MVYSRRQLINLIKILFIIGAIIFVSSCGVELPDLPEKTTTTRAVTRTEATRTTSPDSSLTSPSEKEESRGLEIGETATYDGLEVKVTKYVFTNHLANIKGGTAPRDNNQWCVVYVEVTNLTKDAIVLQSTFGSNYHFSLAYDDDYEYFVTYKNFVEFFESYDHIRPLETITATSSFELPKIVTESNKSLVVYFSKNKRGSDKIGWILRP